MAKQWKEPQDEVKALPECFRCQGDRLLLIEDKAQEAILLQLQLKGEKREHSQTSPVLQRSVLASSEEGEVMAEGT